jgi:hypothetical protein
LGLGIAAGTVGLAGMQQPTNAPAAQEGGMVAKLQELKSMLDSELITQAEFDAAKAKLLGL